MDFEWDDNKNRPNIAKHGISFEDAKHIFGGSPFTRLDPRDYHETRNVSIGPAPNQVILVVVHTQRVDTIRLISARKANKRERRIYHGSRQTDTE